MTYPIPADLSTRLRAVNVLLGAIGESPVSSIETSQAVDVANAEATLTEIDNAVQSEGWSFNREENRTLSRDDDSEIPLPANTLSAAQFRWSASGGEAMVSQRGRRLYDRKAGSYAFTADVDADLIVKLDWEDLPEYARRYITIRAARQFQMRHQGSLNVDRITAQEELQAKVTLEQREDEAAHNNRLSDNPETYGRLHGGARRRAR